MVPNIPHVLKEFIAIILQGLKDGDNHTQVCVPRGCHKSRTCLISFVGLAFFDCLTQLLFQSFVANLDLFGQFESTLCIQTHSLKS